MTHQQRYITMPVHCMWQLVLHPLLSTVFGPCEAGMVTMEKIPHVVTISNFSETRTRLYLGLIPLGLPWT